MPFLFAHECYHSITHIRCKKQTQKGSYIAFCIGWRISLNLNVFLLAASNWTQKWLLEIVKWTWHVICRIVFPVNQTGDLQFSTRVSFFYFSLINVSRLSKVACNQKLHRLSYRDESKMIQKNPHLQSISSLILWIWILHLNQDISRNCAAQANIEDKILDARPLTNSNWAPFHMACEPFRDPPALSLSLCALWLDGE